MLPGERALREEREQIVATMESLTDDEFESAPTLCEGWAPRDILAHVMGVDEHLLEYARAGGWISTGNAMIVAKAKRLDATELLERARKWAPSPAPWVRLIAWQLLGDNAIHHQDVLRPLGRSRDIPEASRSAILREGTLLGAKKLLSYRIEPTDGGIPLGRGTVVRGTRAAMGMWLAGREAYAADLEFASSAAA